MRNQVFSGVLFTVMSAAVPTRVWAGDPGCGFASSVLASLDGIEAKPAQKAPIDRALGELKKVVEAEQDVRSKLANALSEGIEAGTLDHAKIMKVFAQSGAAKKPDIGATLSKLQGQLDETQRRRLWQLATEHQTACEKSLHPSAGNQLALSPDLKQKVQAAIDARAKGAIGPSKEKQASDEATRKAVGELFVLARFDGKKTKAAATAPAASVSAAAEDFIASGQTILPLLTADQRTKLAAQIRSRGFDPTARFSTFLCCAFKVSCCF